MPTTLGSPQTWTATSAAGHAVNPFVLEQAVRLQFLGGGDRFSLRTLQVTRPLNDMAGSGSDTTRVAQLFGLDHAMPWTTGLTERVAGPAATFGQDHADVSLGEWGISANQSATREILQADGVDYNRLALSIMNGFEATWMNAFCATGAACTGTAVGDATRALSPYDLINLQRYYSNLANADGLTVFVVLANEQWDEVEQGLLVMPHLRDRFALDSLGFQVKPSGLVGQLGNGTMLIFKTSYAQEAAGARTGFAFVGQSIMEVQASPARAAQRTTDKMVIQPAGTPMLLSLYTSSDGRLDGIIDGRALIGMGLPSDEAKRMVPIRSLAA